MDEYEFREKFEREKEIYLAWGNYLRDYIILVLKEKGYDPKQLLKIYPIEPRLKDISSLLDKAFHRVDKCYSDPYFDITDKIGIRFVVLIEEEIQIITDIIENCSETLCDIARNPHILIKQRPELFSYTSHHYIVRNKAEISHDEIQIPANTPCEVQIRTLLQHAYAEMSHSQIYKTEDKIDHTIKRNMALSVAIIEATDRLFQESHELLGKEKRDYYEFINPLIEYLSLDNDHFLKTTNMLIYSAYSDYIKENKLTGDILIKFLNDKPALVSYINDKKTSSLIYQQPIICLLYYLISSEPEMVRNQWPLTPEELAPFFTDLGICFNY